MLLTGTALSCLFCAVWGAAAAVESGAGSEGELVKAYSFEPNEDLDYDELPDDWVRRKGDKFPRYVKIGIDCAKGSDGEQSLRIDANGGGAILYSPVKRIDSLHTYRFRGKILTRNLRKDAAVVSVSLLNHRRQRVQRYLTQVVAGTQEDWVSVSIPPIAPQADVRFMVIGCHLLPGDEAGITGTAWFDELVLTRSPGLSIDGGFFEHFWKEDAPINVTAHVSGLDAGHEYALRLEFFDADHQQLSTELRPLVADPPASETTEPRQIEPIHWKLDKQRPGYYRLSATLLRDGRPHLREESSLAVMKLVDKPRLRGDFGWSIGEPSPAIDSKRLVNIAAQSGINWVKYPVWSSVRPQDRGLTGEIADFFEQLENKQIHTIGILSDPPEEIREQFEANWLGVSEIFSTPPHVWGPSIEPVVARFSSTIRHWQLGDEHDTSFEGLVDLPGTLSRTHGELNRIGLNAQIGVPWPFDRECASESRQSLGFLSLREKQAENIDSLTAAWKAARSERTARWVVLQPSLLPGDARERANQLVRRMVAAKVEQVDAIFINQIFGGRNGLLYPDGSPSDLYLPWRTAALSLQGARYLGEIAFPNGSRNAIFEHELHSSDQKDSQKEIVMFIWNDLTEEVTEQFYLGENVVESDLWGRIRNVPVNEEKEQLIQVGNTPKILKGCSAFIAKWRLAAKFKIGSIRSEYGSHEDAVEGNNTFPFGVSGKVLLETPSRQREANVGADGQPVLDANSGWLAEPREWTVTAAAHEPFQLPVYLTLPTDANIGDAIMKLTFTITADRPYRFQVLCPYRVGSSDVTLIVKDRKVEGNQLEIEQLVVNSTSPEEVLDFRCSLMVPGSRRQKLQITKLGVGEDRKFYYLPDADQYRGKQLRLKLEQDGGGRILNQVWTVGNDWTDEAAP